MKLSSFFSRKKGKKAFLFVGIMASFVVAGIVVYRSYAYYSESREYNAIKGMVPSYMDEFDVKVSLTVDGVATTSFPSKESGVIAESVSCDKGTDGSWDSENWMLSIGGLSLTRTKCYISFITPSESTMSVERGESDDMGSDVLLS